jgi:MinD-like ATPase involved in chromosome partitioning or flagellar assembly
VTRSIESLKAFMSASGRSPSWAPTPGVVVVGSGKGGVGTSVVAALVALDAARRGERVLLVDADESVGSLHMMLGISDPGPGLGALRGGATSPESLLVNVAPGLVLMPGGGGGVDATLSGAAAEYRVLMRRVSGLFPEFGTVVVDGGSRLDSVMAACATGVERLLCVTEPDRISLAASYALFKVARARFEALPIELVVNRADEHRGRNLHAIVRAATQTFLGTDVRLGGTIPVDARLEACLQRAGSIADAEAYGSAASAVGGIVHRLLSERQVLLEPQPVVYPLFPGA